MHLQYTDSFLKNYSKRIVKNKTLEKRFQERLQLFLVNPYSPLLRTHKLIGAKKDLYSFSITGDIRVIYYQEDETITLIDVGSHNQLY